MERPSRVEGSGPGARSAIREAEAPTPDRYLRVRSATEALAEGLTAEDQLVQSMPDASPVKWHLAHTSWFFETFVLAAAAPDQPPFHPRFGYLFNSYYEAVGPRHERPRRGMLSRPTLEEVHAYRRHVDERMLDLLASSRATPPLLDVIELGLQHEQQHQELVLTDLKHAFHLNPLRPAYRPAVTSRRGGSPLAWYAYPAGVHAVGAGGPGFAFDNERPRHSVLSQAFEIASRPITAGEFLAFVDAEGYRRPELWLSDGFATAQARSWTAPLYWERDGADWWQFTLGGMREVDEDEPVVHVSYYEADAFARWAEARLPTEEEWERAAAEIPVEGNFAESGIHHPVAAPPGRDPVQLFGDVWEWTRSAYAPYPGYRPPEGALGEYNGKFMCNQLVLRGGSCATPETHARLTYRNFFYPDARWQFSGIRLARDVR